MEPLSFEQALLEASKKPQEKRKHKDLINSLKPLISTHPAFNLDNIHLVKESMKEKIEFYLRDEDAEINLEY